MDEKGNVYETAVHQSLCRSQLMMGCDRELFLGLCLLCVYITGPLGFIAFKPLVGVAGLVLFFIGQKALQACAKADAQMKTVFARAVNQKSFYPARSRSCEEPRLEYPRWR